MLCRDIRLRTRIAPLPLCSLQKCGYCCGFLADRAAPEVDGGLVQCSAGKCTMSYHVTCGHAAGVVFEPGELPYPVYMVCHKHLGNRELKVRRGGADRWEGWGRQVGGAGHT